jgi:hypothetical protein
VGSSEFPTSPIHMPQQPPCPIGAATDPSSLSCPAPPLSIPSRLFLPLVTLNQHTPSHHLLNYLIRVNSLCSFLTLAPSFARAFKPPTMVPRLRKEGRNEGTKEGRNEGTKEGRNEGTKEGRRSKSENESERRRMCWLALSYRSGGEGG